MAKTATPVTVVQGSDAAAVPVSVVGANGDIVLSGDIIVDTFGALDDGPETDPDAASATIPSLLRGIIAQNETIISLLTNIESNTN